MGGRGDGAAGRGGGRDEEVGGTSRLAVVGGLLWWVGGSKDIVKLTNSRLWRWSRQLPMIILSGEMWFHVVCGLVCFVSFSGWVLCFNPRFLGSIDMS